MTGAPVVDVDAIAQAYRSALSAYLGGAGELALAKAYELGRRAVTAHVGVLTMSQIHHEALQHVLGEGGSFGEGHLVQAAHFFAEALAPFEMTLRADAALRQAKEAADAAIRELESFSYSVAHDLRAPLRSIDGFSLAVLEECGPLLTAEGRKYLGYVRESAQHMAQLIDALLGLSRLSRAEVRRTDVDISALARGILERLQVTHADRAVEWHVAGGLHARADPNLVRAAFDNLLGNAWKFTSQRAPARIEVGADMSGEVPVFYVRDNGAGFDMAYASKLFGVFQRLHHASEFEGTGIGLATVQRIVRRHGGRIWAESEVDRGATFHFTLAAPPSP